MNSSMLILPLILGFILDLCLGDPPNWPHPVRWIGNSINLMQKMLRRICKSESALTLGGFILWLVIVGSTFLLTWGFLTVLSLMSWWAVFLAQIVLTYTILATKCLKDAAMAVYQKLENGSLEESRIALSHIVGRDTNELDKPQIIRGVVETVAENTIDGVIAPLFYLFLGSLFHCGVPLAMAYKAVNTLDSMVGYQTPKYKAIGYFSAKVDDAFNYLPARMGWVLLALSASLLRLNAKAAWMIGWRDRHQHKSPNCAWSEATVAGALGVRLGGPSNYFGALVVKPWIGDEARSITQVDIKTAIKLMYLSAVLALFLFSAIYIFFMNWN